MFSLKENVYFTDGAKYGIILDYNTNQMYRLDYYDKERLKLILAGNTVLSDNESLISDLLKYKLISSQQLHFVNEDASFPTLLETVWLELRKSCNLECVHCYNSSNPCAEKGRLPLTLDEWKDIVVQLIPYKPKNVVLIGGEPLLFRDICDFIGFLRQQLPDSKLILYSNLTLLNDTIIATLKQNNVSVVTSLYSNDSENHDRITRNKGSFDKTISSIKKLKDAEIYVKANIIVMSINEDCIEETEEYIFRLTGIKAKIDTIRCVHENLKYLEPRSSPISDLHLIDSPEKFKLKSKNKYLKNRIGNSCWQGKLNIAFDGYVLPCIMHIQNDGDFSVKDYSLEQIINKNIIPRYWHLSKDHIEVCKDCEYRYVCSDCRPMANKLYTRTSTCLYNPYLGRWNVNRALLESYISSQKVEATDNKSEIAFVFSCPGKLELEQGVLCANITGQNLCRLLSILHSIDSEVFTSSDRNDYYITNSSNRVHFEALTRRSEPSIGEISLPENLFRLKNELINRRIIVCMGKSAIRAVSRISYLFSNNTLIIHSNHLSNRGLRFVPGLTQDDKLYYIADQIIQSIKKIQNA